MDFALWDATRIARSGSYGLKASIAGIICTCVPVCETNVTSSLPSDYSIGKTFGRSANCFVKANNASARPACETWYGDQPMQLAL
eukprot:3616744-Amphidinium_carterae.1